MSSTSTDTRLSADFLKAKFDAGVAYEDHVASGKPQQRDAWTDVYNRARLTADQEKTVAAFCRTMHVLVSSGVWCGDCVQQCPLLQRIADANPERVHLRFLDRDQHMDLAERITICGGTRVPVAIFMAEDFEPVSVFGDRTITRYRALAQRQLGPSCPIPGAPIDDDELAATLEDWLDEFERAHLILRLSTRLRHKHND